MNKKIIKVLTLILITLLSITTVNALSLPKEKNSATGYSIIIEDDANLLSEEELSRLQKEMRPLTQYGNIIFKTIAQNYTSTESYASSYYHDRFNSASGTLFLIDMANRYIYIFSDGANYNVVNTAKANIITDNVYKYASDQQYYECASNAFAQINTILEGGKIAEPMRHISNIFIALTASLFIGFFIILVSTSARKATAKEVLANASIDFNITEMRVSQTGTHKEFSPRSSSSGGGGGFSGGGGGGGGSSGGGGGHRF